MQKSVTTINPKPFLLRLVGERIRVKLKWGMVYSGKLASVDEYMNLKLSDVKEYVKGEQLKKMSELLIRCNNILYVCDKANDKEGEKAGDKESEKSVDKESERSVDKESEKSGDKESEKSGDKESEKSGDIKIEKL